MVEAKDIVVSNDEIAFRKKLLSIPGAERLMSCYQCGTCTADCPIAKRVEEFRPRRIARLAVYGQKGRLIEGDTLWLCAGCNTCYERCPEKVKISEIVSALRKFALTQGIVHPAIKALLVSLVEKGYIYEIGEFENEMRGEDGLPNAPEPKTEEIRIIMEKTGLQKLIGGD